MARSKPGLTSALVPLLPVSITDLKTGELVEQEDLGQNIAQLVTYVQTESTRLWEENKDSLPSRLEGITASSPAEAGRQAGVNPNLSALPREVKAKSRIERLVRYSVITSAKSYYNSSVETKEEPTFAPYINLGAVDAQMATVNRVENTLDLTFKCWDKEYLLTFNIPYYALDRHINKVTLPVIKQWGDNWCFVFSLEEKSKTALSSDTYVIGVDLGRVEPYTLAVVHTKTRNRVAQYTASPRLRVLITKRDRLNTELGHLKTKSDTYKALGLPRDILEQERSRTRAKRNRVMDKISWQIAKEVATVAERFSARLVSLEDLTWVNPKHGMSRWTHAKDQSAITHKLTRDGRSTRKVNAKNTSKDCSKCGGVVKQQSGKRLVVCGSCAVVFDRDVNAAVNIALRPLPKRSKGSNCTAKAEVTTGSLFEQKTNNKLLTRKTS